LALRLPPPFGVGLAEVLCALGNGESKKPIVREQSPLSHTSSESETLFDVIGCM